VQAYLNILEVAGTAGRPVAAATKPGEPMNKDSRKSTRTKTTAQRHP